MLKESLQTRHSGARADGAAPPHIGTTPSLIRVLSVGALQRRTRNIREQKSHSVSSGRPRGHSSRRDSQHFQGTCTSTEASCCPLPSHPPHSLSLSLPLPHHPTPLPSPPPKKMYAILPQPPTTVLPPTRQYRGPTRQGSEARAQVEVGEGTQGRMLNTAQACER